MFQIAAHKAVFVHSHFQGRCASILDRGCAEFFGQREHAQDAADTRFSLLAIKKVAECADVSTRSSGSP